jgi:hypothetical protein
MLDLIDTQKLQEICQGIFNLQYGEESSGKNQLTIWKDLAIARDGKAKEDYYDRDTVVICSEGVGYGVEERGLVLIPTGDGNGGICVSGSVLQSLKTGEQIDLADHIRTFGDRLENNFDLWHYRLNMKKETKV